MSWNQFEQAQTIKRRRYFVIKLLQGAMRGLAFMHDHGQLHQSLGPSSVVLKYVLQKYSFGFKKPPLLYDTIIFVLSIKLYLRQSTAYCGSTIVERDAAYLVPRLRDLAFSVDVRYVNGLVAHIPFFPF